MCCRWSLLCLCLALLLEPTLASADVLRTAAQDNNALKYDLKNPAKPGICVEVLQAIEAGDPELRFSGADQPMSLRRIEALLAEGQLDIFCALIRSPAREARMGFIEVPIYTVRHRIAVRAEDAVNVQSLEDIRRLGHEGAVIVNKSTAHEELLRAAGGLQLDASSPDTAVNLKKLVAQRGRFYYHTENALLRYIDEGGLEAKVRLLPTVFKSEALYLVCKPKLADATRQRLHQALEKLARRGELERIYASYREN
jgi:ABC-type amino acid transport substrate-binding protein